jgi:hypothetical protein
MRFNVEDFLKAAGAVAQGTLQGKLQARQIAEQQRMQQQQQSLQLQQVAQSNDDQQFAQAEAYDQHLLQNELPKLAPESQKALLDQINQRKFARQQQRQQRQQFRTALLPPGLQPFFATPPGQAPTTTPVNPTQPQTNLGPGSTPLQAGTAASLPGGMPTQLPTSPAAPAPGTLAPPNNSPPTAWAPGVGNTGRELSPPPGFGAPLAPQQAMGMPTPEQMGQTPAPPPTAPPAAPGASSGAAPPTPNRRFTIPGLEGDFEMAGLTKEQLTDYQKRREQARTLVGSFAGDPTTKAALDQAWTQLPDNLQTGDDLQRANQLLNQIESYRAGNNLNAQVFEENRYKTISADREKAVTALRDAKTSPQLGAALVRRVLAREGDLQKMGRFDPDSEGIFAGFPDEKAAYEQAVQDKDPKKAGQILESVAGNLRNNENDSAHAAANTRALYQIISNMSAHDRNDPKKVAQMARVWGQPEIAARIEKEGVTFGGYRADKAFYDLLKEADQWKGMDDTSKDLLLSELKAAAIDAGKSPEEIRKIVAAKLGQSEKPLTAYQKAILEDRDQDRDLRFRQYRLSEQKFGVYKRHMENLDARAGSEGGGASLAAKLRGPQHAVDQKWEAYQQVVNKYALTDDQVKSGATPLARQAQGLLNDFNQAYNAWATVYQRELGVDPRTGNPAPKGVTNASAPRKPLAQMTDAELSQAFGRAVQGKFSKGK